MNARRVVSYQVRDYGKDKQLADEFIAQADRAFALVGRLQRRFAARFKKVRLKSPDRTKNGKPLKAGLSVPGFGQCTHGRFELLPAQFAKCHSGRGTEPFDHAKNALSHERIFPQSDKRKKAAPLRGSWAIQGGSGGVA